ncbi:MAG: Tm-1-like ATP-binding domain-containing protein [Proteobacteria bacterium]|nr:Tm-1-like ATP-binding domain-containing protein [Pseudomonadota bacterium]
MDRISSIAVLGTFDTKGEEHLFLKKCIEQRGVRALTINVGTKKPASCTLDFDLFNSLKAKGLIQDGQDRDQVMRVMLEETKKLVKTLHDRGEISGIVSAGGGSGTYLCTGIMRVLPLGIPKVMLSTVAARDMTHIVGTKDITMMPSVSDILGINSILGGMLDKAAAAVCAMAKSTWIPDKNRPRIALSFFGFITQAAEQIKELLEKKGYEVVTFHANGTGGTAMEELASEGFFKGILDLATHELADKLMNGYCGGIGPHRFETLTGIPLPRLIIPGGLDCAVLEFDRYSIPEQYKDRKIFFYDFRSAIRLNKKETKIIAQQLSEKLNPAGEAIKVLIPLKGWSVADSIDGPLYDPETNDLFIKTFKENLVQTIIVKEENLHINDPSFAKAAADMMDQMIASKR